MLTSATPSANIPVMLEVTRCFLWHKCGGVGASAHGGSDVPVLTRACLVIALTIAGSGNEAITAANSVLDPSVAANLSRVEAEHGEPASWWARRARNSYIL
jgi:hypothetical protein